jgi:large subunit ribosomal protein L6
MAKKSPQNKEEKKRVTQFDLIIPAQVTVSLEGGTVKVKGPKGELAKKFNFDGIDVAQKDGKIIFTTPSLRKEDKALLGSKVAHIRNLMKGASEGVTYKMKMVYSHFPMNAKVVGDRLAIDNFLGEKHPRKAKIIKNVTVEVKGQDLTVKGIDLESVAQTAANIEQTTRIKGRDLRVFQDGIYITNKDGIQIQ